MKRLKSLMFVFAIVLAVALFLPQTSNAAQLGGYSTSLGSGGSTASSGGGSRNLSGKWTPFVWITVRNVQQNGQFTSIGKKVCSKGGCFDGGEFEQSMQNAVDVSFLSLNTFEGNLRNWIPWGINSYRNPVDNGSNIFNKWVRWDDYNLWNHTKHYADFINTYTRENYMYPSALRAGKAGTYASYTLPNDMRDLAKSLGFRSMYWKTDLYEDAMYFNPSTGQKLDLIYTVDPWKKKTKETPVIKLIKEECDSRSSGSCGNPFDYSNWSPKKIFEEAPVRAEFSYVSKEGEYEYNHKLKYTFIIVRKIETWKEKDGQTKDYSVKYETGKRITTDNTADWQAEKPVLDTKFYKPYDLYTEQQIPQEDANKIFSGDKLKYLSNDPLKLTVDNRIDQDMNAKEKYLTTIDDNGKLIWELKFHNDQFGIPTKAEGGIDIKKDHRSLNEVGLDNIQYYEPKFTGSSDVSNQNSSIQAGSGNELRAPEEFAKYYGHRGDTYTFRSIKTGTYKITSKAFKDYWSVRYSASEYFKYGSKYNGTVSVSTSGKVTWTGINSKGTINIVDNRIYTGEETGSFVQPILRGTILVKTVGGYNP